MSRSNEKISNKMIIRAVELWARALRNPKFDNGDNSRNGFMTHALVSMNIEHDKKNIDSLDESIKIFKSELIKLLIKERDSGDYFTRFLDTDYHPCKLLSVAAEKAGIPESQFSVKSGVQIYEDYVISRFGYGAKSKYHYPLDTGDWLITDLSGYEDMEKIFKDVIENNTLNLTVEKA